MNDSFTQKLAERRDSLKYELVEGDRQRELLKKKISELDTTLVRIAGAIQVLDEMIAEQQAGTPQP